MGGFLRRFRRRDDETEEEAPPPPRKKGSGPPARPTPRGPPAEVPPSTPKTPEEDTPSSQRPPFKATGDGSPAAAERSVDSPVDAPVLEVDEPRGPPPPLPPADLESVRASNPPRDGSGRCFLCNTELVGSFCPTCRMTWNE